MTPRKDVILGRERGGTFYRAGPCITLFLESCFRIQFHSRFLTEVRNSSRSNNLAFLLTSMSNIQKLDDGQATFTVFEDYELNMQRHHMNRTCGKHFFRMRLSFRVWQVLLFLLGVAVIIAIMGLLIAMFGPGNTNLRYSKKEAIVAPTVEGNGGRSTRMFYESTRPMMVSKMMVATMLSLLLCLKNCTYEHIKRKVIIFFFSFFFFFGERKIKFPLKDMLEV